MPSPSEQVSSYVLSSFSFLDQQSAFSILNHKRHKEDHKKTHENDFCAFCPRFMQDFSPSSFPPRRGGECWLRDEFADDPDDPAGCLTVPKFRRAGRFPIAIHYTA